MPGGKTNPFSMSNVLGSLNDVVSNTKENFHSLKERAGNRKSGLEEKVDEFGDKVKDGLRRLDGHHDTHGLGDAVVDWIDVRIQFIGARDLPRMDIGGSADPYFVASIVPSGVPSNSTSKKASGKDGINFVSNVKPATLSPIWNEIWRVRNVPVTAELLVKVMDKDDGMVTDDYVGTARCFLNEVVVNGDVQETRNSTGDGPGRFPGTETRSKVFELPIEAAGLGRKERNRGTFWMKVEVAPSKLMPTPHSITEQNQPPSTLHFLFDGPIRYSRHFSPTVGALTAAPSNSTPGGPNKRTRPCLPSSSAASDITAFSPRARLYSTWKLYLKAIPLFLRNPEDLQPWNKDYKAAQSIFGSGPGSLAVRSGIMAGHRMLYARTRRNGFGVIGEEKDDGAAQGGGTGGGNVESLLDLLKGGPITTSRVSSSSASQVTITPPSHRIKPVVYTYIISAEDDSFRFSETGAAFFVDFASKHALHANCATAVRYSGEFHVRPQVPGGWVAFIEQGDASWKDEDVAWEIVIDNNSGTYSPSAALLPSIQKLMDYNFGIKGRLSVVALDHEDEELKKSREACKAYALQWRGAGKEELDGNAMVPEKGKETLAEHVKRYGGNVDTSAEGVTPTAAIDDGSNWPEHAQGYQPTYMRGYEPVYGMPVPEGQAPAMPQVPQLVPPKY